MNTRAKVLAILLMRFKIRPAEAISMVETWLKQNPQESWESLRDLLLQKQVTLSDKKLININQSMTSNSGHSATKNGDVEVEVVLKQEQTLKSDNRTKARRRYRGIDYS